MNQAQISEAIALGFIALLVLAAKFGRRPLRLSATACGTAHWMNKAMLRFYGMLGREGLVLARTNDGALIRVKDYVHTLLIAGTGAGKGVGIVIPNLLTYYKGSIVCFDPKGDLFATTAERRRKRGQRIVRLGPCVPNSDKLNPLDLIPRDSPTAVDDARSCAESLVVTTGAEPDRHWNDKAVQILTCLISLILLTFADEERSLNSVQDIASDPMMMLAASAQLIALGGIPERMGNQIKALFAPDNGAMLLTKEGAGVMSTVQRHLAFLDSELVADAVSKSTFNIFDLKKPGITVYIQIAPNYLKSQAGLLRCWLSTMIRAIGC
jgi:type IV secretion system protein VirD4